MSVVGPWFGNLIVDVDCRPIIGTNYKLLYNNPYQIDIANRSSNWHQNIHFISHCSSTPEIVAPSIQLNFQPYSSLSCNCVTDRCAENVVHELAELWLLIGHCLLCMLSKQKHTQPPNNITSHIDIALPMLASAAAQSYTVCTCLSTILLG